MGFTSKFKSKDLMSKMKLLNKEDLMSLGLSMPPKKGWKKIIINHFNLTPPVKQKSATKIKKPKLQNNFYSSWEWKKLRYKVLLKYGQI